MRWFQTIFALYMIWLLAFFVPAHRRGMITMGPRDADSCCVPLKKIVSCCEDDAQSSHAHQKEKSHQPTPRDIANCAVCYWCAIVLPITFSSVDLKPVGIVASSNYFCESALIQAMFSHDALPRGPPVLV